jgi:hypothetical protein
MQIVGCFMLDLMWLGIHIFRLVLLVLYASSAKELKNQQNMKLQMNIFSRIKIGFMNV